MKRCSLCRERKDRSEFNRKSAAKDGLQPYCRACQKLAKLRYKYGLELECVAKLLSDQHASCAICRNLLYKAGTSGADFVVDHDHRTGEVRGLLCRSCNILLGLARDDTDTLKGAIRYLEKD